MARRIAVTAPTAAERSVGSTRARTTTPRSAPIARQVGRSAAPALTARTSAWPTERARADQHGHREQEQSTLLDVADLPHLAHPEERGGALDVGRPAGDPLDVLLELREVPLAALEVNELVRQADHLVAVLPVEADRRHLVLRRRRGLDDADDPHLLTEALRVPREGKPRRQPAEVRRQLLGVRERRAEIQPVLPAHHLVHDDLVGAAWIGLAAVDQRLRAQPHRPGGLRDEPGLGPLRALDAHQERKEERVDRLHLGKVGHGPLLGRVVLRVVREDRRGGDVRDLHEARCGRLGAARPCDRGAREPDRDPGEQAEHHPRPPAAAQVGPHPQPHRTHRRPPVTGTSSADHTPATSGRASPLRRRGGCPHPRRGAS